MKLKLLSSLEKVFPNKEPMLTLSQNPSCLKEETFNFQVGIYEEKGERTATPFSVDCGFSVVSTYAVKLVPTTFPAYNQRHDNNYLSLEPGLFPDLLKPTAETIDIVGGQWRSLWVEIKADRAGSFPIAVKIGNEEISFELKVIAAELPCQELIFTQWFHCDCISSYYGTEPLSEEHWVLMDKFMANAAKYGMSMILTPVLTPPLDTEIGGERPTVQLVDITVTGSGYEYKYEKLDKYIDLARKNNIKYLEISHPFTQWGAKCAPKVVAVKNGELQKLFGWETDASSPEYTAFIRSFLISLKKHLTDMGVIENCYFHVSDEPGQDQIESYTAALKTVEDIYDGLKVCDALSSYDFYKLGLVKNPIPANDHIEPFIENNVPDLWTYYCCAQCVDVSNRFLAMHSARNRIIGHQLYKFNIKGFLHWGYNFWYSQYSKGLIDPYFVTDSGEAFPGGDPFSVYPGEGGTPYPSVRQLVFAEALQDLRAMRLLEKLRSRQDVLNIIDGDNSLRFAHFNHDPEFVTGARERVNAEIQRAVEIRSDI